MLQRFGIPVFQTIVFNYLTCVVTGSVVAGASGLNASAVSEPWFGWALFMGCLFILLFNLIGYTTQKIGVAVTSVANKLSLVIPFVFSIYLYNEAATALKISGIVLALIAVYLTCLPPAEKGQNPQKRVGGALLFLLPAILFVGSGLLDVLVKYVEQTFLNDSNSNAYLIAGFGTAGLIGSIMLVILVASGKQKFDKRSIVAGIAIGIPNYFSIWCLVHVLKAYQGHSSAIIPINNMGIVLLSSVVAWMVFKERLSAINWAGIGLSIIAIALIAFG